MKKELAGFEQRRDMTCYIRRRTSVGSTELEAGRPEEMLSKLSGLA